MTGRRHQIVAPAGLVAAGVGSMVAAVVLDSGALDEGSLLAATMLRTTVGAAGAYAVLLGGLSLLAALFGWGRALRWSGRLGAARFGLAAGVAVASFGATSRTAPTPVGAVEADAPAPPTDALPIASLTPVEPPIASLIPLPDDTAPASTEDDAPPTWIVEQGDHLWAIAEAQVGEADDRAVHDYWVRLVELNTDRLVVPDDPDLILPGQELLLPERSPLRIDGEAGAAAQNPLE